MVKLILAFLLEYISFLFFNPKKKKKFKKRDLVLDLRREILILKMHSQV